MKDRELCFKYKGKELKLNLKECNFFERFRGLMFRKKSFSDCLLFDFKKPVLWSIHSFFVNFDFIAIWLDDKNNVIETKKVKPFIFRIKPKQKFSKLVEIPMTKQNKNMIQNLVEK